MDFAAKNVQIDPSNLEKSNLASLELSEGRVRWVISLVSFGTLGGLSSTKNYQKSQMRLSIWNFNSKFKVYYLTNRETER